MWLETWIAALRRSHKCMEPQTARASARSSWKRWPVFQDARRRVQRIVAAEDWCRSASSMAPSSGKLPATILVPLKAPTLNC